MLKTKLRLFLRLSRPAQWLKNTFVLGPLLVAGHLDPGRIALALALFGVFCLSASTVYIWNDLFDRELDKLHPTKQLRPLASGEINPREAKIAILIFGSVSLLLGMALSPKTALVIASYFFLNICYTLALKKMVILDLFAVASNYLLRIIGGAVVINEPVTPWVIILGFMLALFLAIGKRRGELRNLGESAVDHRQTLGEYSIEFLDRILTVTTTSIVAAYIIYTLSPELAARLHTIWMPLTIPFVLYGLYRYLYLINTGKGESPAHTILADRPLFCAIGCWGAAVLLIQLF